MPCLWGNMTHNITTGHFNVSASDTNPVFILVTLITYLKWTSVCVIYDDDTDNQTLDLLNQLSERNIFVIIYHTSEVTSSEIDALARSNLNKKSEVKFMLLCSKLNGNTCGSFLEKPFDYDRKNVWRNSLLHFSRWVVFVTGNDNAIEFKRNQTIPFDNVAVVHIRENKLVKVLPDSLTCNAIIHTLLWQQGRTRAMSPVGTLCKDGTLKIAVDVFPNAKHGFNGRKFIISTLPSPPFTIKSNNTKPYTGFLMEMLRELSQSLNFTYVLRDSIDGKWGALEDEKTNKWNGLVGELQRREVDLVVASLTINPHRGTVMDFTYPYHYEFSAIFVKKQSFEDTRWTTLLNIFRPNVLLFTGVALIVMSLILFALEKYSPYYKKRSRQDGLHCFSESFWYMYGALLTQGGEHMAQALSGRTFLTSWWLFCIILAAAYSGNFVAFLTVSKEVLPFSNLEELVHTKNYKFGTIGSSIYETILKNSDLPERVMLWNKIVEFNKTDPSVLSNKADKHIQKVVKSDFYAFLSDKSDEARIDDALMARCELTTIEYDLLPQQFGLGFPKHSPFVQLFSDEIVALHESGLISMWKRRYFPTKTTRCQSSNGLKTVTVFDIQIAFYLIGCGICLSFILLCCEFIYWKFLRCRVDSRSQNNGEKSRSDQTNTLHEYTDGWILKSRTNRDDCSHMDSNDQTNRERSLATQNNTLQLHDDPCWWIRMPHANKNDGDTSFPKLHENFKIS